MTHRLSWLLATVGIAAAAFAVTRVKGASSDALPAADVQEMAERLQKLERELPTLKRSMSQVGAQLGSAALRAEAAPASAADPAPATSAAVTTLSNAAERAAKELAHYERLDSLIRAGGGAATSAQLRKNVEQAGKGPGDPRGLAIELSSVDCGDALCRVELRMKGPKGLTAIDAARALGHGMGGVTMRPREPGKPDVFYVAAPGQRLPSPGL